MTRVLIPLAATALTCCITLAPSSEHVRTGAPRAPHAGEVKVLMEGSPVPGEYDEVGVVTASGYAVNATLPAVIEALRKEAAALGANAVVRVRYDRGASGATATGVAVWLK